jgi:hypothetical protein
MHQSPFSFYLFFFYFVYNTYFVGLYFIHDQEADQTQTNQPNDQGIYGFHLLTVVYTHTQSQSIKA